MPIDPSQLLALVEEKKGGARPYPPPWGVLLARPNPDGSRKQCSNCPMWASKGKQCSIHAPEVTVTADHVCGYHVYGPPMDQHPSHPGMQPVDPTFSGLEQVPGGTSCDICRWYESSDGERGWCHVVAEEGTDRPPTPVEALMCCARWEAMENPESGGY